MIYLALVETYRIDVVTRRVKSITVDTPLSRAEKVSGFSHDNIIHVVRGPEFDFPAEQHQKENTPLRRCVFFSWRSHGESNPGFRRERPAS